MHRITRDSGLWILFQQALQVYQGFAIQSSPGCRRCYVCEFLPANLRILSLRIHSRRNLQGAAAKVYVHCLSLLQWGVHVSTRLDSIKVVPQMPSTKMLQNGKRYMCAADWPQSQQFDSLVSQEIRTNCGKAARLRNACLSTPNRMTRSLCPSLGRRANSSSSGGGHGSANASSLHYRPSGLKNLQTPK